MDFEAKYILRLCCLQSADDCHSPEDSLTKFNHHGYQNTDQHENSPSKEACWSERIEVGPVEKILVNPESVEVPAASTPALVSMFDGLSFFILSLPTSTSKGPRYMTDGDCDS